MSDREALSSHTDTAIIRAMIDIDVEPTWRSALQISFDLAPADDDLALRRIVRAVVGQLVRDGVLRSLDAVHQGRALEIINVDPKALETYFETHLGDER
jgi:hypothetical protein